MIERVLRAASTLLLISLPALAFPARAETSNVISVDRWSVWGATAQFSQDDTIAGNGALRLPAGTALGEDWSSGAGLPIPFALNAGEQVTATFWARSAATERVRATIQGGAPSYTSFVSATLDLAPGWKRFTLVGVAPSDFPAGSQSLTLMLGKAGSDVSLGPVLFAAGDTTEAAVESAFADHRPAWVTEDVRIPSDPGVLLAGTLRTPPLHERFPVVLLIGGSGPGERGGLNPLMERLLGEGMAVLEYDKRGVNQSTGEYVDTLQNMGKDAAAAVQYLRTRGDIDGDRIVLVGHSQGGAVAPAVATEDQGIAGVVMLAGPVAPVKPGKVNLVIMADILTKAGVNATAINQVIEASDRLFETRGRGATADEIALLEEAVIQGFIACNFTRTQAEGALATLNSIVLEGWNARFDRTLASVRAPVLAVYASEDEYMSTADNLPAAKAALARNRDATVIEIADVNHGFQHVKGAGAQERNHGGPFAAPEVVELVGDWLNARLHPGRAVAAVRN